MTEAAARWRKDYADAYAEKSDAWNAEYVDYLDDRREWLDRAARIGSEGANEALLTSLGVDAEARENRTLFAGASDIGIASPNAAKLADELLSRSGFADSRTALLALAQSGSRFDTRVARGSGGPSYGDAALIEATAKNLARKRAEEASASNALIMAENARRSIAEIGKNYEKQVADANEGFDDSMDSVFASGGYVRSGDAYTKDLVVNSTLGDTYVTRRTSVGTYRGFIAPTLAISTRLDVDQMARLDAWGIEGMIDQAQDEVKEKFDDIFGTEEDRKAIKTLREEEDRKEADAKANPTVVTMTPFGSEKPITFTVPNEYRKKSYSDAGLFGKHLGYAPEFKDGEDLNLDKSMTWNMVSSGEGELARIMGAFQWNAMVEANGYAAAGKPFYERAMWDDYGSSFKAPSLRSAVDLGVAVAATICTAGSGLPAMLGAAAMNLADDAVFSTIDAGSGAKSWAQAGLDFGKKVASSAVSTAVGGVFNGFGGDTGGFWKNGLSGFMDESSMSGVIGKTMLTGLQTASTMTATNAINAFQLNANGSLGWSSDAFAASTFNINSGASILSGMAGTFASGSLGLLNKYDWNGTGLSDKVFDTASIGRFNGLAGGLTSSAVTYAMTGNATFNVLNLGMIPGLKNAGGNPVSMGLLEMNVGKDGFGMQLGQGGTDISLGTIAASLKGLSETIDISKFKLGGVKGNSTLAAINQLGHMKNAENWELAKRMKSGTQDVIYEGISGGLATTRDGSIVLDERLLGRGLEESAQLAGFMAHEDDHLKGRNEESAYIREYDGFSDLQTKWVFSGESLISGIGEMSAYYREYGRESTLKRLGNQGLLESNGPNSYAKATLDKATEDWVISRYGFDGKAKDAIMKSEIVRAMYGKGAAIWKEELADFLSGEGKRLGIEGDYRETELKKYAELKAVSETLKEQYKSLSVDAKKKLKAAGIDIENCDTATNTLLEATQGVLARLGPEYMNLLIEKGLIDKIAEARGVSLPPGLSGFGASGIGDFLRTGELSGNTRDALSGLGTSVFEDLVKDALTAPFFKGKMKNQAQLVMDIFKTNVKAAAEGYAYAVEVTGLSRQYYNSLYSVERAGAMFGYTEKGMARALAGEMASYRAAQEFMSGGLADMDTALRNYMAASVASSPMPINLEKLYKDKGYQGMFLPTSDARHRNTFLPMILNMTSDARIYQSFVSTVNSVEWFQSKVYVTGSVTNRNLNEIYKWRDKKLDGIYDNRNGWKWSTGGFSWW